LTVRAIDRETRRLDAIEQGHAPGPASPAGAPPATASLPAEAPTISGAPPAGPPPAEVPVPYRDPRRSPSKPHAPPQPPLSAVPQASTAPPGLQAAPLPAPILIRPAPAPKPVRPRQPLVLTPPASTSPRSAF
jgi:large subunit ribosomal protein L24